MAFQADALPALLIEPVGGATGFLLLPGAGCHGRAGGCSALRFGKGGSEEATNGRKMFEGFLLFYNVFVTNPTFVQQRIVTIYSFYPPSLDRFC